MNTTRPPTHGQTSPWVGPPVEGAAIILRPLASQSRHAGLDPACTYSVIFLAFRGWISGTGSSGSPPSIDLTDGKRPGK